MDGTPSSQPAVLQTYAASLFATDTEGKHIALATPTCVQVVLAAQQSTVRYTLARVKVKPPPRCARSLRLQ